MIRHVVMLKMKEGTSEEAVHNLSAGLKALESEISLIKSASVGEDVLHGPNSVEVCLIFDFENLEELQAYKDHPAHVKLVKELLNPYLEKLTACDFEL